MKLRIIQVLYALNLLFPKDMNAWGFFAHKRINRLAVFMLPSEMATFYKQYIVYITENAINPDQRRYAVEGEAPKHYIDIDIYGDSALYKMPRYWNQAVEKYTEDTLMTYGINPWWVHAMKGQLMYAFKKLDAKAILRISADLGHYIADGNVPLHTTHNYNGQYTNQVGIHGFWESRLPELFSDNYDYYIGQAEYVQNTQLRAWKAVTEAHLALDSVLGFEKIITERMGADKKYSYEERNGITVRVYSRKFSEAYHNLLAGQVERRMRASIKMVADFWYTAWVDAGQPNLRPLSEWKPDKSFEEEQLKEKQEWELRRLDVRPESKHKSDSNPDDHHHAVGCCSHHDFYSLQWQKWQSVATK